ncbi:MAG: hypothetical protein F9K24_21630 [Leptonema illini]|jgi:hypothetical protein|uniref:Uncharacterized protein n=1 Tax=Leptonema illini TaxID=183 RepID=A0A833GWY6_9LEPT|nr:MAG: hypothetical protein F9K24_21630 [Leptonema illini]
MKKKNADPRQLMIQFEHDIMLGRMDEEEVTFYRSNITEIKEIIEKKKRLEENSALRAIIQHVELFYGK